jgi:hypothetical protein
MDAKVAAHAKLIAWYGDSRAFPFTLDVVETDPCCAPPLPQQAIQGWRTQGLAGT